MAERADYSGSLGKKINRTTVLEVINNCISCLKNGGRIEDILWELAKAFEADEAVYLSPRDKCEGVSLRNSFALSQSTYLSQYAEKYWRFDPLYKMQFCTGSVNPVFKTSDVIPYAHLVKLNYYESFLRPQNLLSELVIRLCFKNRAQAAISLLRHQEHPEFSLKDIRKAILLVPYLTNLFEMANRFIRIDNERMLMEQWMESSSDGIILLDSDFVPVYWNSRAKHYCDIFRGANEPGSFNYNKEIVVPQVITIDCRNLRDSIFQQDYTNRIISTGYRGKYYIQYFVIRSPSLPQNGPQFVIFISTLVEGQSNMLDNLKSQQKLTPREGVIAQYVALGFSNKEIAARLGISYYTVQNHLKNIFSKTGMDNRARLATLIKRLEKSSS